MVEDFVESVMDKKRVKDQLGKADTVALAISKWRTEQLNIYNMRVRVYEIDMSAAFVLGHATYGKMGTQTPQPYISTGGSWLLIAETPGAEQITNDGKSAIISFLKGDTITHFNKIAHGTGTTPFNVAQASLVSESGRITTLDSPLRGKAT